VENVIEARDLRKSFAVRGSRRGRNEGGGRVEAVRGVSIEVGRGEIFGFLGPNGAGKPKIGIRHFFSEAAVT
jgi:ABC-2 type transport system ATP-binding protein